MISNFPIPCTLLLGGSSWLCKLIFNSLQGNIRMIYLAWVSKKVLGTIFSKVKIKPKSNQFVLIFMISKLKRATGALGFMKSELTQELVLEYLRCLWKPFWIWKKMPSFWRYWFYYTFANLSALSKSNLCQLSGYITFQAKTSHGWICFLCSS